MVKDESNVLREVYLGDAYGGNPVFPEDVHHLLKGWWTTQKACGKTAERGIEQSDTCSFCTRHKSDAGVRFFIVVVSSVTIEARAVVV